MKQEFQIRPPRDGDIAEGVFARKWAELNSKEGRQRSLLGEICAKGGLKAGKRQAAIAANIICWLGCHMGSVFLDRAKFLSRASIGQEAYLMAWSVLNRRQTHVNGGWRLLEGLMRPIESKLSPLLTPPIELQASDYEMAELVVAWLGSVDGQEFLADCEAQIDREERRESVHFHLTANLGLTSAQSRDVIARAVAAA